MPNLLNETAQATRVSRRLKIGITVGALSLAAAASALFVWKETRHPYEPPPPRVGFFSSGPRVDVSSKREFVPYSQTELLVVFRNDVQNPAATVADILQTAPKEAFRSLGGTADVTAAFNARNEARQREQSARPPATSGQTADTTPRTSDAATSRGRTIEVTSVKEVFPGNRSVDATKTKFPKRGQQAVADVAGDLLPWQKITFTEPVDVATLADHFRGSPHIKQVSLNRLYETSKAKSQTTGKNIRERVAAAGDPYLNTFGSWGQPYADLWGVRAETMDAVNAWPTEDGDPSVIIAVVDTGADYNHEDLAANIWRNGSEIPGNNIDDDQNGYVDDVQGYDFTTCEIYDYFGACVTPKPSDADPMDGNGHGTHVAGTIAAIRNNSVGIAGVCPTCKVMAIKGLNDQGGGASDDLAQAIRYAADNGADVINMSWGSRGVDATISNALDYAAALGVQLIAAAGNSDDDVVYYFPASHPWVHPVAATDAFDNKASFSNWGANIDLAAPGVDILSLRASSVDPYGDGRNFVPRGDPNAKYMRLSGTSMASPHVAGLVGLAIAKYNSGSMTPIYNAAEDVNNNGWDIYYGYGRVNARRTVQYNANALKATLSEPNRSNAYLARDSQVTVRGTASGTQFASYTLEYAQGWGEQPTWTTVYSSTSPADDGGGTATLTTWDTTGLRGRYVLRLTVHGTDGSSISEVNGVVTGMLPGWPVDAPVGYLNRATVVDFDSAAPGEELVYTSSDWYGQPTYSLLGFRGDGTPMNALTEGRTPGSTPTFADLDQDGLVEVLAINGQEFPGEALYLRALHADGTSLPGFPVALPTLPFYEQQPTTGCPTGFCQAMYNIGGASVADLDRDGDLEIAVSLGVGLPYANDFTPFGRVLIYGHDGQLLTPALDQAGYHYRADGPYEDWAAPTFGDLDGNGDLELIVMDNGGFVRAFQHDGTPVTGWPRWAALSPSRPVVTADLDGDGRDEVLVLSDVSWQLHVWHGDGRRYGTSPYGTPGTPSLLAVADVDADGVQELIVKTINYLSVYRRNGVPMTPFPVGSLTGGSASNYPVIVDDLLPTFNGAEILWTDRSANLGMATAADGQPLFNPFPIFVQAEPSSIPLVGDFTGDGTTDVAYATYYSDDAFSITGTRWFAFDLGLARTSNNTLWPYIYHDREQTKRATCPTCTANESRPYDSQTISCDDQPGTPACDRTGYAHARCGSNICLANCTCTRYFEQQEGWPVAADLWSRTSILSADVDADGLPETLTKNTTGTLYRSDGSIAPGFPLAPNPSWLFGGEYLIGAIGNVSGDGKLELAALFNTPNRNGVALFDHQGNRLWEADLTQASSMRFIKTVVIADVIPESPGREVVAAAAVFASTGVKTEVFLFSDDGSIVAGFPATLDGDAVYSGGGDVIAVGDLDIDGYGEIVLTMPRRWESATGWHEGRVVTLDHLGTVAWEVNFSALDPSLPDDHQFFSIPSAGDVDPAVPGREVVVVEETYPEFAGKVHVLSGVTGQPLSGWPAAFGNDAAGNTNILPVLADFDADGLLEIAVATWAERGSDTNIFLFEHTGSVKNGWPIDSTVFGADSGIPLFVSEFKFTAANVDSDNQPELIVIGAPDGNEGWALNDDGSLPPDWPISLPGVEATPAFADLDNDGDTEFLVSSFWEGALLAYDLTAPVRFSAGDWRSERYDAGNSGVSDFDTTPPTTPSNFRLNGSVRLAEETSGPQQINGVTVAGESVDLAREERNEGDGGDSGGIRARIIPLAWDASTDTTSGVAGYKLHWCTGALNCVTTFDRDLGSIATTFELGVGTSGTYNIEVSAYDAIGNESGRSNRVSVNVPAN